MNTELSHINSKLDKDRK